MVAGGAIYYITTKIAFIYELTHFSGGLFLSGEKKTLELFIIFCLGLIAGFLPSIILVAIILYAEISKLNWRMIFLIALIFGIIHSLVWIFAEYNNQLMISPEHTLDSFGYKQIIVIVIKEFISGSLIGLVSALFIRFAGFNFENEIAV